MNKIQKELYQAPGFSKIELNNMSLLLTFSISGDIDPIEKGEEDRDIDGGSMW